MTVWKTLHGGAGAALAGLVLLGACAAPASDGGGEQAALAGSPTDGGQPSEPQIDPMPSDGSTPVGGRPWDEDLTAACAGVVDPALTQVAQVPGESGTTSFWSAGRRWAVCDGLVHPSADVAPVLTVHAQTRDRAAGFDESRLALGSAVAGSDDAPEAVRFTAGGLLPWPVEEISYTFPDGHVEQARFVASEDGSGDTWWVVAYTATDGPLVDPGTPPEDLGPVTVTVVGAAAEAFRVPWEDLQRTE